jgi:hypothetical protein
MRVQISILPRVIRYAVVPAIAFLFAGARVVLAAEQEPEVDTKPAAAAATPVNNTSDEAHGIKIGEFKIRSDYPAEAQKSTVRFVLFAAVKGDRLSAMEAIVSEHREKLRDEVITATRLTPLSMFEEPDLKSFRRHIFIRLHRTVPELVIDDLYISDFGLIVKSL